MNRNVPRRKRVTALVTRPRAEAATLAAALAEREIDAIIEPLLDINYTGAAIPDLCGIQAVLCTSVNGVRALARATTARDVPLLAVGPASASRAAAEGFTRVESAGGDVGDLVRLVSARLHPSGGPLLHVAGSVVTGDLAGRLRDRGFSVDRLVLYDAQPASTLSEATTAALRAAAVDFLLLFSPRTAAVFARLAGEAGLAAAMQPVTAISLSHAADAALGALPLRQRVIAARPDQAGLLATLDAVLAERLPV